MSNTVIKVENLSKQYRLGTIGTGSISHDINRWWHTVRGKEDPYLKIGETNDRSSKGKSDYVWSLKNIDFEIKHGDAIGIIGRNGAGKSTLLKILSRVTSPTAGSIKVKGRIASLLEVGTGFHPELSGRENIYLNGAILGMRKYEVKKKFDEIVDFAGVERYIDTPVKRYSSGMYVRLAFAVAAHLEPEILIVDEVLAVGDAEFQKKCISKLQDVNSKEGRTIIFVSHNVGAISLLTKRCILLKNGILTFNGPTFFALEEYFKTERNLISRKELDFYRREDFNNNNNNLNLFFSSILVNNDLSVIPIIKKNEEIVLNLEIFAKNDFQEIGVTIFIKDNHSQIITVITSWDQNIFFNFKKGKNRINITLPCLNFYYGDFFVDVGLNNSISKASFDVITNYPLFKSAVNEELLFWQDRPSSILYLDNIKWDQYTDE